MESFGPPALPAQLLSLPVHQLLCASFKAVLVAEPFSFLCAWFPIILYTGLPHISCFVYQTCTAPLCGRRVQQALHYVA